MKKKANRLAVFGWSAVLLFQGTATLVVVLLYHGF
jgi:hypothetical protein